MDFKRLHEILNETTLQLRKGEVVEQHRVGALEVTDIYAMTHSRRARLSGGACASYRVDGRAHPDCGDVSQPRQRQNTAMARHVGVCCGTPADHPLSRKAEALTTISVAGGPARSPT